MRKLVLLAAMLAMVLVAAAPAFAQTRTQVTATDSDVAFCQNVANQEITNRPTVVGNTQNAAAAAIVVTGDANATAENLIQAGVDANVAQQCAATIAGNEVVVPPPPPPPPGTPPPPPPPGTPPPPPAPKAATLPATGGASLFALGAGALLVGGGLVARRIIK